MNSVIIIFLVLVVLAGLRIASLYHAETADRRRRKKKENPCESCLRWDECNGVDRECPLRKED